MVKKAARSKQTALSRRKVGRPAENEDVRREIILGAARVFGQRGYPSASVEDILLATPVSRRTFYRHFRSKEDVLDALHERAAILFLEVAQRAYARSEKPLDRLDSAIDGLLDFFVSSGPIAKAILLEGNRLGSPLAPRRARLTSVLIEMLSQGFRDESGHSIEPFYLQALTAAIGAVLTELITGTEVRAEDVAASRRLLKCIVRAALRSEMGRPG